VAALAVAAALMLASCGGSSSTPQATLHAFLGAWSARDWTAMKAQVIDPPDSFVAANVDALAALGVTRPQFTAARVRTSGSDARVRVTEHLALPAAGAWNPVTTVKLADHGGRWLVAWSSATINPALRTGDRLSVSRSWPARAQILGAGGAPLTTEHQLVTVGVVGSRIKSAAAVTADLLGAGASRTQVDQALAQAKTHPDYFDPVFEVSQPRFEQLKAQPGPSNVYAVPGTQFELAGNRTAITPQLAAHVVGSVGPITAQELNQVGAPYGVTSVIGQTGIEQAYERRLAGTPRTEVVVTDAGGAAVATLATFPGHPGTPVRTSLDPGVQRAAEAALSSVKQSVAMVAMRVSSAQILAVVSDPISDAYDQALEGEYPPGSTFKVLTSTALIRAGLTPSSPASCPPTATIDGEVFHNAEGDQPLQTLDEGFVESCNTTFITLAIAHLKPADFTAAARLYGLNATPQPGLPAFAAEVPAPTSRTALAATAIGQAGVVFSPLGMAMLATDVASGRVREPRLIVGAPDDSTATGRVPADVDGDLQSMMAGVVQSGTAAGTGLPSGTHAKTGTAQYESGGTLHYDAWLMGYDGDIAFAIVVQDSGDMNGGPLDGPIIARFLHALP
jgi:cell division protein FtsI/penicillin-binding protein 2